MNRAYNPSATPLIEALHRSFCDMTRMRIQLFGSYRRHYAAFVRARFEDGADEQLVRDEFTALLRFNLDLIRREKRTHAALQIGKLLDVERWPFDLEEARRLRFVRAAEKPAAPKRKAAAPVEAAPVKISDEERAAAMERFRQKMGRGEA